MSERQMPTCNQLPPRNSWLSQSGPLSLPPSFSQSVSHSTYLPASTQASTHQLKQQDSLTVPRPVYFTRLATGFLLSRSARSISAIVQK